MKVKISDFLQERKGRYKPKDQSIQGLKRIEKIDFSGQIYLSEKPSNTDMILVKKGDLVISGINVEKGAMCVYEGEEDITATIHYSSYTYNDKKIDLNFFKYFLKSPNFVSALKEQVPGGIKTEIKPKHVLPLEISIPKNISDQIIIVERLDELNEQLNSSNSELIHQLYLISQLRQAFLREAMQGALVSNETSDGKTGADLLEEIKKEKEQLIKDKKIKKGKLTKNSKQIMEFSFPNNWQISKLDDLFFVTKLAGFEYSDHMQLKNSGEVPVIRAQNVRNLELNKNNLLFIDLETSILLDRCSLKKECLLITFIGAGIGDVATFKEKERWHLAPNVAKAEPFAGVEFMYNIKYFNYFLISSYGKSEISKHMKATAQPSLSMETIRDIDIPLPPLEIQNRMVAKLDELMQYCDALEASVKESQNYNAQLLQQVLREALEGKEEKTEALALVAEDMPNYQKTI
ncbi:restriction endonuclease subunit S [Chryseobacterium taklimakanense]|nr:restriction endonuclease subunit S [Chryseobacterium taklimakanense]